MSFINDITCSVYLPRSCTILCVSKLKLVFKKSINNFDLKEQVSMTKICLVSNGSKEQIGQTTEGATASEEFEPWRGQQQNSAAHTGYGASVPISNATDIYNMGSAGI